MVYALANHLQRVRKRFTMRTFIALGLWFLLLVFCWPIAFVMLIVFPFVWLILLPFRILGFTLDLIFKLVGNIFLFPFRQRL